LSVDTELCEAAGVLLDRAERIAIVSHHRPDGDAIGATEAVRAGLRERGKHVDAYVLDPVPQRYQGLTADDPIDVWSPVKGGEAFRRAGAIVVLDTASWSQLEAVQEQLRRAKDRTVVVDHHQSPEDIGAVQLVDSTAAATGLLVYEWFRALGWFLPPVALRGVFAAIATDTGWFRFSNTDARALRVAADLVADGIESHRLYEAIYWSESASRVALMARALGTLELHQRGRIATMRLDQATFRACGAQASDSEDLINEPMRIGSVWVSCLLIEQPDGSVRVSLRSKGQVDVAAVASGLGGGGHVRAAGLRLPGPTQMALEKILRILRGTLVSPVRAEAEDSPS
jgi:phosphoesterase RecJ-like protein